MLGRVTLFIFSLAVIYSVNAFAAVTSSVYQIDGEPKDTLTLIDDSKTIGEEILLLEFNEISKTIKVQDVGVESYGGAYLISDETGTVREDLTIEVVFKSRYEQILLLLQDENFRAAFTVIPDSCPSEAVGFLLINDNLSAEAFGHCLLPQAN